MVHGAQTTGRSSNYEFETMLSQTRRALEDFDNQHDFERMAADVLNALGYSNVEPMAQVLAGMAAGENLALRDDVVVRADISKAALAAAPDPAPPYFRVPKVIDR